jgi:hypothetical protein
MSSKKEVNSWDAFIEDAREKLASGKAYVRSMRAALRVLETNKAKGIPLPSEIRKARLEAQQ